MAYKSKKYHETKYLTTFAVIVAAALIVFLIGIGISRIAGAQNTTVILSNGEEVKFTGMFDKDGNPISGTLYYANGISAEHAISYEHTGIRRRFGFIHVDAHRFLNLGLHWRHNLFFLLFFLLFFHDDFLFFATRFFNWRRYNFWLGCCWYNFFGFLFNHHYKC